MDGEKNPNEKPRPVSPRNGQPVPVGPGRPKGLQNKTTTQFKDALNNLLETSAPNMIEWLAEIKDPEKRFDILAKFAEYVHPKLARSDNTLSAPDGGPVQNKITVEIVQTQHKDS